MKKTILASDSMSDILRLWTLGKKNVDTTRFSGCLFPVLFYS